MRVAASINPDQPTRGKCHVTVSVHLAGLTENMTINVLVASGREGNKKSWRQSQSKRFRATVREPDLSPKSAAVGWLGWGGFRAASPASAGGAFCLANSW